MKKRIVMFIDIDSNEPGQSAGGEMKDGFAQQYGADTAFVIHVRKDPNPEFSQLTPPPASPATALAITAHEIGHSLATIFELPGAVADPVKSSSAAKYGLIDPKTRILKSETEAWDVATEIFNHAKTWALDSYRNAPQRLFRQRRPE